MKKVILLHGCPDDEEKAMSPETRTYDKHWIPWTIEQLSSHRIEAKNPSMPEPWHPDYEKFKQEFEKNVIDEDTILVGHSCGCSFLVRWLGDTKKKISKLILVAPWKIPYRENKMDINFYTYPVDETITDRVGEIVMFTADNEHVDGKKSLQIFHDALGGQIIELKNHGHYTLGMMGTEEFPELLETILK